MSPKIQSLSKIPMLLPAVTTPLIAMPLVSSYPKRRRRKAQPLPQNEEVFKEVQQVPQEAFRQYRCAGQ
jgi:hypothetical protein